MKIDLTEGQVENIVQQELKLALSIMHNTDESGNDITDHEMEEHLRHVLAYYSSQSDFLKYCSVNKIDPEKYM